MLRQSLETMRVVTPGEGFTDLTGRLNAALASSGMEQGLLNLVCLHTSCSLTINENADPRVLRDLSSYLRALVPEEGIRPVSGRGELRPYVHADEGSDDMPAHIRTALT
ncbi:MAG: YjbQ family protein, partial [Cyanobium sp. MAG_04]|nr:YjbQ family protein [Cyanobium sp. MAG_04]